MPANLGIPPWLQGQDIPGSFLKGAQIGAEQARIGAEQQRLQVQSQQAQQQMLQDQQRLEIAHQYQQQQIALRHQQLQEVQQMNQAKMKQFTMRAQGVQAYEKAIAEGMNPTEAARNFLAPTFTSGAGVAALFKGQQATVPESLQGIPVLGLDKKPVEGLLGVPTSTGSYGVRDVPKTQSGLTESQKIRAQIDDLKGQQKKIEARFDTAHVEGMRLTDALTEDLSNIKDPEQRKIKEGLKKEALDLQKQLQSISEQRRKLEGFAQATLPSQKGATHRWDPDKMAIVPINQDENSAPAEPGENE
jgi:hypothetical protein